MHPRQRIKIIVLLFPVFFVVFFLFTPPDPKIVDTSEPSLNYPINNFTVSSSYQITGEFVMGREVQIICFLQLENIPTTYNWTNFELELVDESNETIDTISGNIWKEESTTSYSIENRFWTLYSANRFLRINLTLPEEDLIQFKLSVWFEKQDFFPLYQDKWVFRYLTDKFVIESRPLLEQIVLGASRLMANYLQRQLMQKIISIIAPIVIGAGISFLRKR